MSTFTTHKPLNVVFAKKVQTLYQFNLPQILYGNSAQDKMFSQNYINSALLDFCISLV